MSREIRYSLTGYSTDLVVEVTMSDKVKIPDETINKTLIVAMNYLLDNMTINEQESAE